MKHLPSSLQLLEQADCPGRQSLSMNSVPLDEIAAVYGTPVFVYSADYIRQQVSLIATAFGATPHLICYSVKANSNLSILKLVAEAGCGFDIVSRGELERVLAAGGNANNVVFSGVGKRWDELEAALNAGIRCFNVESEAELLLLNEVAISLGTRAPVALRINPNVDPKTHPYISTGLQENKFGIAHEEIVTLYQRMVQMEGIAPVGLDCHIGSQLLDLSPMLEAFEKVLTIWDAIAAAGISLVHIDIGGGFGIDYDGSANEPNIPDFGAAIAERIGERKLDILLEPGRSIVGNSGVMLTQVQFCKTNGDKNFVIVDAAMNDLIRPALYGSHQRILPTNDPDQCKENGGNAQVVGPICESGDFLGKDRDLSFCERGDILAVLSSGAYGFVMASVYNTRPNPPEVLVDSALKAGHKLIRRRQTISQLFAEEIEQL